eukprot:TRINITY_DN1650_c0_g1_i5.p1 TRINITY_DN1650_c0_g1~~TRINITY_DN1650_c0_g1_i5.p1  ORF type:complete len:188 (+),score=48.95 TRINITY_DN1650_c0_g1_i5:65-628(+)
MCIRDRFYIIQRGIALVYSDTPGKEFQNFYQFGDYFGETAILTSEKLRKASVKALTDLTLLVVEKHDFLFVFGDKVGAGSLFQKLLNLANVRKSRAYEVIGKNLLFSTRLFSSQKIHLEMLLRERKFSKGEFVWTKGVNTEFCFVIDKGAFKFVNGLLEELPPLEEGIFVGEIDAMMSNQPLSLIHI